jgi:hypothetical protein
MHVEIEFDHKSWSPCFNHFEIELALDAGNDVKIVTAVQPMLLHWSLWFQDGGVSNFSGFCMFGRVAQSASGL